MDALRLPLTIPLYPTEASCVRALYMEYDFSTIAPPVPSKRRPSGRSFGAEVYIALHGNCIRLAGGSQFPRKSLTRARNNSVGRPMRSNRGDTSLSIREKFITMDGKTDVASDGWGNAYWRILPLSFVSYFLPHLISRRHDSDFPHPEDNPSHSVARSPMPKLPPPIRPRRSLIFANS